MLTQSVADTTAGIATGISVGALGVGLTIGQLNQFLQAGAFIVAIISGVCASIYYIRNSKRKDDA